MKITLSKRQWEFIGKQAGWVKKTAQDNEDFEEDDPTSVFYHQRPPSGTKTLKTRREKDYHELKRLLREGWEITKEDPHDIDGTVVVAPPSQ